MGVHHIRVTLQGTLSDGLDIWSCGFSTPPITGFSSADAADMALTALTLFETNYWAPLHTAIPTSAALTSAKVAQVTDAGVTEAVGIAELSTPDAGTVSTAAMPPECSVCVSLRTPVAGAKGRGRMYLPPLAANNLTNAGQLIAGSRDSISLKVKDFFDAWNADPDTLSASVASGVGGFVTAIDRIQVGLVVDSQRRRRNTIPEVYVSQDIVI